MKKISVVVMVCMYCMSFSQNLQSSPEEVRRQAQFQISGDNAGFNKSSGSGASYPSSEVYDTEAKEFERLMKEGSREHSSKTVAVLNALFDQDVNSKEAILHIQNKSNCNMILRVRNRNKYYNMPVPANGENTIVVDKGIYQLSGNLCRIPYTSTKTINKSQMVILRTDRASKS